MQRIGIDLGGTKIEGILLGEDSEVVVRRRIPTLQEEGYEAIVGRISGLIRDLQKASTGGCRIGICTPGSISPRSGFLRNSNTVCLNGMPFKDDLEASLGVEVKMENDANCFALAEAHFGAARGFQNVFGVIMGTGVGGGIVLDGKVHQGRLLIGGEWGHSTLHPQGNLCFCGRRGCVETYLSGPALQRRWNELTAERLGLPEIVSRLDSGLATGAARRWKAEFLTNFGLALSNVINILDPDAVVLGGGVSNIRFLYDEGLREVHRNVFSDFADTPILRHQLGDSSGVFGAACLGHGLREEAGQDVSE